MKCIAKNKKGERCGNTGIHARIFLYCNDHHPLKAVPFFIKNKLVGLIIVILIIFISIIFKGIISYESTEFYKNIKQGSSTNKEISFRSDSSLKILILPFTSSFYCNEQTILCEREIKLYFEENFTSDEVETIIDTSDNDRSGVHGNSDIELIANNKGADIVFWGDYQYKCNSDSTKIEINYLISQELFEPSFRRLRIGKIPKTNISINEFRTGKLMVDMNDIINLTLGWKEFLNQSLQKSIYYFEKYVVASEYESIEIYSLLGLINLIILQYERGIHYYSKALQINPFNVVCLTERASCYKRIRKCDLALLDLNRAIDILTDEKVFPFPGKMLEYSSEIYNDRANLWISCPDYIIQSDYGIENILYDYDRAIRLDSNFTLAYLNKAMFLYVLGDTSQVFDLLNKAHTIEKSYDSYIYIASYYYLKGFYQKSLLYINQAIELNQYLPNAYAFRIKLHKDHLDNFNTAQKDYKILTQLVPNLKEEFILVIPGLILEIDFSDLIESKVQPMSYTEQNSTVYVN